MNYKHNLPYPSIQDLDINIEYGQIMLSHLGGIHSKMNNVILYHYNHVILHDTWKELSDVMKEIAIVEMQHFDILAKMCFRLGVDPRLWDCQDDFLEYWSPGYNVYPRQVHTLLENAILQQQKIIELYRYQIESVDEPIIQDVFNRMILDEEQHIKILTKYLKDYLHP